MIDYYYRQHKCEARIALLNRKAYIYEGKKYGKPTTTG